MAYGSSLGITLPTVGVSTGPGWATSLNTALTTIIATLEAKVTPAGLDINADLSFTSGATAYRAKDVKAVSFTNQDSALSAGTYACTLFTSDSDGELYWNDNAGRQVQVTSNGEVNVSTTGGVTGSGYGSTSVEINWDSANTQYKMRSGSGADDYADVLCRDLKLNDGSNNELIVSAPSLVSSYTLTLPDAVPAASNSLLEMDISGNVTTTKTPSVTSVTTSDAIVAGTTLSVGTNATVTGTLGVTGTSTFTGKATFVAEYAHPQRVQHVSPMECTVNAATLSGLGSTPSNPHITITGTGQVVLVPIRLLAGDRLESITFYVDQAAAGTRTYEIVYWNTTVGVWTAPGGGYRTTSSSTAGLAGRTLNNTDITIATPAGAGTGVGFLYAQCTLVNTDEFWGAEIAYSRP